LRKVSGLFEHIAAQYPRRAGGVEGHQILRVQRPVALIYIN